MTSNNDSMFSMLKDFRKRLAKRAARNAGWDPDAGRKRKEFMDEVMEPVNEDPTQVERAWTILELVDMFETADGYFIKRGTRYAVIKLKNDEETTLLEISPQGELAKPSKRNTSLLPLERIKAYRAKLESICPDRKLTRQEQVQQVYDAAMEFKSAVTRRAH